MNILSDYIAAAIKQADITPLDDGTVFAKIPKLKGVIAFGETKEDCLCDLQSILEGWILLGLQLNHKLPVINGINLNRKPLHESKNRL